MAGVNTDLTKRPYLKTKLSQVETIEFVRSQLSPKHFIRNYCYIQHPTKGKMEFDLFEYQERLLDSYHDFRYSISLLPRQTGKSTTAAAYLLWYAMFIPDSTILIAAHKFSGAQEIMARIRYMYETCPDFIRAGIIAYNRGSIEFDNGSKIVAQATTENTGRGMSLTLVYLDEFAFVKPRIADEFWTSLSPTLSTGGKCIITSTPNQDDDQFAKIWKQAENTIDDHGNTTETGKNGFKSFRVDWREHPDRDDAWAAEELGKIGEERFRREFGCEFIAFDETLISSTFLADMHTGDEPYKRSGNVRWYDTLKDGETYMLSLDPSLGTGGDPAAIQIFSINGLKQVGEWQHNKTTIQNQVKIMRDIMIEIEDQCPQSEIYWSVENNTLGEAALVTISEMGEDNIPGVFLSEPKKRGRGRSFRKGFTTTHQSKLAACAKLKRWVEESKMKIKSKNLIRELKTFTARGNSFSAKEGSTDDLVMATILIVRMAIIISRYDEESFIDLKDSFDDDDYHMPLPVIV